MEKLQLTITRHEDGKVTMSGPEKVHLDELIGLLAGSIQVALASVPTEHARDISREMIIDHISKK